MACKHLASGVEEDKGLGVPQGPMTKLPPFLCSGDRQRAEPRRRPNRHNASFQLDGSPALPHRWPLFLQGEAGGVGMSSWGSERPCCKGWGGVVRLSETHPQTTTLGCGLAPPLTSFLSSLPSLQKRALSAPCTVRSPRKQKGSRASTLTATAT